jgi:hypothetical protein
VAVPICRAPDVLVLGRIAVSDPPLALFADDEQQFIDKAETVSVS